MSDALHRADNGDLGVITRYRKPVAAPVGAGRLEQLERAEAHQASGADARDARPTGVADQGSGDAPAPAAAPADRETKELLRPAAGTRSELRSSEAISFDRPVGSGVSLGVTESDVAGRNGQRHW